MTELSELPLSERIILAVSGQLETITTGSGYKTDAGLNVLRSMRTVASFPALVVWDLGERTEEGAGNHRAMLMSLDLNVDAHVTADQADTGKQLELVKADIKKALLSWARLGGVRDAEGKIGALIYLSCETNAREDGASSESVSLKFLVNFKEVYGNPYSSNQ